MSFSYGLALHFLCCLSCPLHFFVASPVHYTSLLPVPSITLLCCQSCPLHFFVASPVHYTSLLPVLSITLLCCQSCPLHFFVASPVHYTSLLPVLSIAKYSEQKTTFLSSASVSVSPYKYGEACTARNVTERVGCAQSLNSSRQPATTTCVITSGNKNIRGKWVSVTTAWRVLSLRMEERPPVWKVALNILNKQ
jgi:hypothetical protein